MNFLHRESDRPANGLGAAGAPRGATSGGAVAQPGAVDTTAARPYTEKARPLSRGGAGARPRPLVSSRDHAAAISAPRNIAMGARPDVCVIGGGLAGLSVGALLAKTHEVVLLEREPHLAYHSSGRSAALFAESYGNAAVRALTRASRAFYLEPGGAVPYTSARGAMYVADDAARLDALHEEIRATGTPLRRLDARAAQALCPALRADVRGALLDVDARDIDVAAVVDAFARRLRAGGGEIRRNSPVTTLTESAGRWRIGTPAGTIDAAIVVDAAGAWADEVAALAGVPPVGLTPRLRTAVRVAARAWRVADWPCVIDAAERWYFRPDAGALILSPADETAVAPGDVQPDDQTVAETIARVEAATQLVVDRPLRSWAGLRTFASDRTPVVGYEPGARGFFWLAGQGGYGIQAAPALAELAAALIEDRSPPAGLRDAGVDADALAPARLRLRKRH
jgi:D-arginine dehydrogenase